MSAKRQEAAEDVCRATYLSGRSSADHELGRLNEEDGIIGAGLHHLEIMATSLVCPWVEQVFPNDQLWEFARSNLLQDALEFCEVIDERIQSHNDAQFVAGWRSLRLGFTWTKELDVTSSYGEHVSRLLLFTMVLKQYITADDAQHATFQRSSTNVATALVPAMLTRLPNFQPSTFEEQEPLAPLLHRIADWDW